MPTISFDIPQQTFDTLKELAPGTLLPGGLNICYPWQWSGPDEPDLADLGLVYKSPEPFLRHLVMNLVEDYEIDRRCHEELEFLKRYGVTPKFKTVRDAPKTLPAVQFEFNRDFKRRSEILGISPKARFRPRCPIHFEGLHVSRLKQLVDESFIDLDEQPPMDTPKNRQFYDLVTEHPAIHVSGLAYVPEDANGYSGIYLTGLAIPSQVFWNEEDKHALILFSLTASELEIGKRIRAWWD